MFDFASMSPTEIVGQIIGFCAVAMGVISYQAKTYKGIMAFQVAFSSFWVIHFILLGDPTGALLNFVAFVRNFAYALKHKFPKSLKIALPYLVCAAFIGATVFTFTTPMSIIPCVGSLVATVALYISNERILRILSLIVSASWLTYGIYVSSIPSALNEILLIISIIVALIRYRKVEKT